MWPEPEPGQTSSGPEPAEVSRAWDGFQQITKFSAHNDTGAIATWTRHGLVTKSCLLSNHLQSLQLFIFPPANCVIDVSDDQRMRWLLVMSVIAPSLIWVRHWAAQALAPDDGGFADTSSSSSSSHLRCG